MTDLVVGGLLLVAVVWAWWLVRDLRTVPAGAPRRPDAGSVSVVVPARDEEATLPALLASVGSLAVPVREHVGIAYVLMMSSATTFALLLGTLVFFKEPARPADLAPALPPNHRGFLGSSFRFQLLVRKNVFQVQADVVGRNVKQLRHLCLRQPHGLAVGPQLDATGAVLGGVENQAAHALVVSGTGNNCCIRPCLWVLRAVSWLDSAAILVSREERQSTTAFCSKLSVGIQISIPENSVLLMIGRVDVAGIDLIHGVKCTKA